MNYKFKHLILSLLIVTISIFLLNNCAAKKSLEDDTAMETGSPTENSQTPTDDPPNVKTINWESSPTSSLVVMNIDGNTDGNERSVGSLPSNKIIRYRTTSYFNKSVKFPKRDLPIAFLKNAVYNPIEKKSMKLMSIIPSSISHNDTSYTFKVYNTNGSFPTITAQKKYGDSNTKCLVYLEEPTTGSYGSVDWNSLGQTIDNSIITSVINTFGQPTDIDNNSQIVIVFYELSDPSICGYFYSGDLYSTTSIPESNEMEVIYINLLCDDDGPSGQLSRQTIAHELQHCINYSSRVITNSLPEMDIWLDEGLAMSAEHVMLGQVVEEVITYMKIDQNNLIRNGFPLCVWTGDLENYTLSYLFMSYCRIQADNGSGVFKEVIENQYGDYKGIESIMNAKNSDFTDFKTLLMSFFIANLLKQSTGIYGYKTENIDYNFQVHSPTSTSNVKLKPGGCIYINSNNTSLDAFTPESEDEQVLYIKVKGENN
ncbi:hypothetical protein ACFLZV_02010 [Candidatus Margulisiibacteriota bacterium]